MIFKKNIALSFIMFFIMIISAPSIIVSCDDSEDTSILFGLNEEEQEDLKISFEYNSDYIEDFPKNQSSKDTIGYANKNYLIPHLSLVLPPPKLHFIKKQKSSK